MKKVLMVLGVVSLLAGCGNEEAGNTQQEQAQQTTSSQALNRQTDFAQVSRGGRLFRQNCAECHGQQGEGAPNWQQREPNGAFPPPPLNGTGHAWHHPKAMLHAVIKKGGMAPNSKMPAWGEELSDQEIDDVIAWFMAQWPDEVYEAWYQMNQNARRGG